MFAELRRRNVFKVGAAYLLVAWLLAQVVSLFVPALQLPEWTVTLVALLLIVGFPVAVLLAWVYELTPEGVKRTEDVPAAESVTHITGRKLNYVIVGSVAVGLALVVAMSDLRNDDAAAPSGAEAGGQPPAATARPEPAARAPLENSIAVLPLDNLSPDPNNAYVAAGLHEEILNQLAKLRNLNVIARTSVTPYAESKPSIAEIARVLNVESIMEGSVRYAGSRIRVTTQLIDARTGAHLWSETYDREFDDIFAIESDIAMNVANALIVEFSLEEQAAIEAPLTASPEAYELYLQAREAIRTALPGSSQTAHQLLDRAIAIDPMFARAHATKAMLYSAALVNTTQGTGVAPEGREELERLTRASAQRALALDPVEPFARVVLRAANTLTWRWGDYVETLTPSEERVLEAAGLWVISWMGRHADAIRIAQRNVDLSPNDATARLLLGIVQAYAGDRAASVASIERSLELAPANPLARAWLAYDAVARGDDSRALDELRLLERMIGETPAIVFLPELAYAYARIGRSADAARFFAAIEERAAETDVGVGTWAVAYLAVGDEDEALRQLEIAAEKARNHEPDQGYLHLMNLRMNFLADPRLEEPRFAGVLSRIRGD